MHELTVRALSECEILDKPKVNLILAVHYAPRVMAHDFCVKSRSKRVLRINILSTCLPKKSCAGTAANNFSINGALLLDKELLLGDGQRQRCPFARAFSASSVNKKHYGLYDLLFFLKRTKDNGGIELGVHWILPISMELQAFEGLTVQRDSIKKLRLHKKG